MQIYNRKLTRCFAIFFLIVIGTFLRQLSLAGEAPIVDTGKITYDYGEMITVNFSNAPGNDSDWICIAPAGSPETEPGDYKYTPKGVGRGFLTFDSPKPGKYEARAYYHYRRNGYVVSGRYAFTVVSTPEGEAAMARRMERKVDPTNAIEANLSPEEGLVYIFRTPLFVASHIGVPVKINGKQIVVMSDSQYCLYQAPKGAAVFTTGNPINVHSQKVDSSEFKPSEGAETRINIKPGYVNYVQLMLFMTPLWNGSLLHMPHQEGANNISTYKLTQVKRDQ